MHCICIVFRVDILDPQRNDPFDFGDPMTSHVKPPAGQIFNFCSEISQHLLDRFGKKICADIYGLQRMNPFLL